MKSEELKGPDQGSLNNLVDAFPAFLAFWEQAQHKPLEEQILAWETEYMAPWPELLAKQIDTYTGEGEDWRQIARERVFPYLAERLPLMREARDNLLRFIVPIHSRTREVLAFDVDIAFVIYVGIGLGAGWATPYDCLPAVLFGLENIAECGWSRPPELDGLIAHEIGHLAHFHWREENGLPDGSGPMWQLYSEGLAMRCEHKVLGIESWHMSCHDREGDWLAWCKEHRGWLAAEFLRMIETGEPIRPFFGSWFEIRGRKQTGYFLGHELVRRLESTMSLREIALLGSDDPVLRRELEALAESL